MEIDTDTPVDSALLLECGETAMIHQQGLVATKIVFDKMTVEPLEVFMARNPSSLPKDTITRIRLGRRKEESLVLEDKAITYHGCQFTDLPLEEVTDNLKLSEDREFITNIQYPLVAYIENARTATKLITVALNGYSFDFRDSALGLDESVRLYMPPLWFRVTMHGNNVMQMNVAVVSQYNGKPEETKLSHLPLPNIYHDTHICLGHSRISGLLNEDLSDGAIIANSISRFFCSNWNTDLMQAEGVASDASLEKMKQLDPDTHKKFVKLRSSMSGSSEARSQLRCIEVMTQPAGWMDLSFKALKISARGFLGCGR